MNLIRKRLIPSLLTLLTILLFLPMRGRAEERKLTLMVYICGSNLESMGGSASWDIQEMVQNYPGGDDVSVILMTGGSRKWYYGFKADQIMIHEAGLRGIRPVWSSASETCSFQSMGDPATLEFFLKYGIEHYRAQDYALILWDHGGGPLKGICWDETQNMDQLTVSEMTSALRMSLGAKKLAWIGFDACLMGSMEMACELAPYARYMIASQETEPATGWDYSFLRELPKDRDGAETGRRIIDAYFEKTKTATEELTLSCIDLSRMTALTKSLDDFFAPLALTLSPDSFPKYSAERMNTVSFGDLDQRAFGNSYDLVDLSSLVSNLDAERCRPVLQALNEAIVYSRSGMDGAKGLSIYHPYFNKTGYSSAWHDQYRNTRSSQGYADYIFSFGKILTGDSMTDWSGLRIRDEGKDAGGSGNSFACALTPEQADQFAGARLLVLRENKHKDGMTDVYTLVGNYPAQLGEDGVVRAVYNGRLLYAVRQNENEEKVTGPLSYQRLRNKPIAAIQGMFQPADTAHLEETDNGLFLFNCSEGLSEAPILDVVMHDDATGTYSRRIPYQPDRYSIVYFRYPYVEIPSNSENGTLPAFSEWHVNEEYMHLVGFYNNEDWSLRFFDEPLTGDDLFVLFEITDLQQNTFCSSVTPVPNPSQTPIAVESGAVETEDFRVELSGCMIHSELEHGLRLDLLFTNISDKTIKFRMKDLQIDKRFLGYGFLGISLDPGQSVKRRLNIKADDLIGLKQIQQVRMILELTPQAEEKTIEEPISFTLKKTDLSLIDASIVPLAEIEKNDILCQVLDTWMNSDGDIQMLLRMVNRKEKEVHLREAAVNGIQAGLTLFSQYSLPPKADMVITVTVHNDVFVDAIMDQIRTSDIKGFRSGVLSRDLQQRNGRHHVENITVGYYVGDNILDWRYLELQLNTPQEIPDFTPANQNNRWYGLVNDYMTGDLHPLVLLDSDDFTARAERILAGDNGLAFVLEFINKTNHEIEVACAPTALNGTEVNLLRKNWWVMPGCTMYTVFPAEITGQYPYVREITDISLTLYPPKGRPCQADLSFASPVPLGTPGGFVIESEGIILNSESQESNEQLAISAETRYLITHHFWHDYPEWGWTNHDTIDFVVFHKDGSMEMTMYGVSFSDYVWNAKEDGSVEVSYIYGTKPFYRFYESNEGLVMQDEITTDRYRLRPIG